MVGRAALADFNSIKVRLEQQGQSKTIARLEFQFHKGTIRTSFFLTVLLQVSTNFNSIKVRLERLGFESIGRACLYFNSIKVRLEHWTENKKHLHGFISIP